MLTCVPARVRLDARPEKPDSRSCSEKRSGRRRHFFFGSESVGRSPSTLHEVSKETPRFFLVTTRIRREDVKVFTSVATSSDHSLVSKHRLYVALTLCAPRTYTMCICVSFLKKTSQVLAFPRRGSQQTRAGARGRVAAGHQSRAVVPRRARFANAAVAAGSARAAFFVGSVDFYCEGSDANARDTERVAAEAGSLVPASLNAREYRRRRRRVLKEGRRAIADGASFPALQSSLQSSRDARARAARRSSRAPPPRACARRTTRWR